MRLCSYGKTFITAKVRRIKSSHRIKFVFKKFVAGKVRVQMVRMRRFVREELILQKVRKQEFVRRYSYRKKLVYKVRNGESWLCQMFVSDKARIKKVLTG